LKKGFTTERPKKSSWVGRGGVEKNALKALRGKGHKDLVLREPGEKQKRGKLLVQKNNVEKGSRKKKKETLKEGPRY